MSYIYDISHLRVKDECVGRSAVRTDCEQGVEGSAEHGVSEVCDDISSTYWFFLIPLQAWTGPEGSSRLRLPDFKTVGT